MRRSTIAYARRHGHLRRLCLTSLHHRRLVSRALPAGTPEIRGTTQRGFAGFAGSARGYLGLLSVAPAGSRNPVTTEPHTQLGRLLVSGKTPHGVPGTGSTWRQHPGNRYPAASSRFRFAASTLFEARSNSSSIKGSCIIAARLRRFSLSSSAMATAYSAYRGAANGSQFTITAMGRWSCLNKTLPRELHHLQELSL